METERGHCDSRQSRYSRQNKRLDEELGNNAAAARAQRSAQADFLLTHRRAGVHENRNVQTDKYDQRSEKTLRREETGQVLGSVQANKGVSVGQRLGPELRVDLWKR